MKSNDVAHYLENTFNDIVPTSAWGETSFFYNPDMKLKRGVYFATLKSQDGDNDKASYLNRDGVYRLNIGISVEQFERLFGPRPKRPQKGNAIQGDWNFEVMDTITPHPVYGWMGWISVLNPSEETFETIKPLLENAYLKAKSGFGKRIKKR